MPKIEKILGELTENSPELPRFGIIVDIFTARKRSVGQGNVFTPVCHDQEGSASSGVGQTVWDTVNKRAVRILLECILVKYVMGRKILKISIFICIRNIKHFYHHIGIDFSEGGKYLALAERRDCKDFISVFECASWHLVKVSTFSRALCKIRRNLSSLHLFLS